MKEGWEKTKLAKVANCQIGLTYKPTDVVDECGTIVLRSSNIQDSKITLDDIVRVNCAISPSKFVKNGDILMCSRNGSFRLVGKVAKIENLKEPMSYGAFMTIIRSEYNDFLFYFFLSQSFRNQIFIGQTATINQITTKMLNNTSLAIPPLLEQQRIVEELDLLSSIIGKKKEQLKELDNLAQSIFYDMFGDPVTNEKGWDVSKLGEICIFLQGEQVPIEEQSVIQHEGMVRFLRIIDFTQGNEPPRFVFCKDKKHILDNDEIAIVRYGSPGFVCYGKYGVIANNLFKIAPKDKDRFAFRYLIAWLSSEAFQSVVNGNQYGAALQAIKFGTIKDIPFIQPPLDLQQQFASKIEAIERQKELIKQSIKEVETLFSSRMDYYFN